jgi:hypothetical protein
MRHATGNGGPKSLTARSGVDVALVAHSAVNSLRRDCRPKSPWWLDEGDPPTDGRDNLLVEEQSRCATGDIYNLISLGACTEGGAKGAPAAN